jgi:hypothetical protein
MKNVITRVKTPLLSNSYSLQCNHLFNHSMHGQVKTRATNILCLRSSIVCSKSKKKFFFFKPWKKGEKKKKKG